jgi:outer membrane protein TolC
MWAGAGPRSMIAVAEPIKTVRGLRVRLPRVSLAIAFLTILLLIVASVTIPWGRPAQGAETRPVSLPETPLTFEESVKIAINQSPYLTKSSLEIDIRKMDENDSRYGMVPPLTFRTVYYVNRPNDPNLSPQPYSLSFSTDPYNPLGAYFSLQAQKLATKGAIYKHLLTISEGLKNLGQIYLDLAALKKVAVYQKDLVKESQEKLTYMENRLSIGTATSLDVKVAQQELELAKGELKTIDLATKRNLNALRGFLGLPPSQQVNPDLRDADRQVLGSFTPDSASLEQSKNRSYEIKIFEVEKKLQKYNISLAIAKVFPSLLFNTQTPDPLSATNGRGLYVGVGLEIPVWDGFKRIRNVSRQKTALRQLEAQKDEKESSLENKWNGILGEIQDAEMALKLAKSREELARLKSQQNEVRYQSGELQLPVVLDGRKEVLTAQKDAARNNAIYGKMVLKLREASGDLGNTYVHASSFEE